MKSNQFEAVLEEHDKFESAVRDPFSTERSGVPPNLGSTVLPHAVSFQGIVSSIAKVYRPSDEALRDSYENARFMRNDVSLMECIEHRQRSTALLDWDLETDDENDVRHEVLKKEMRSILNKTYRFMQLRENLLHALWYGKYGVQPRYNWVSTPGGQRVGITGWLPTNGDKLVFRLDQDGMGVERAGIRVGPHFEDRSIKGWDHDRIEQLDNTEWGRAYFLSPWERRLIAIHKHYIEDGDFDDPRTAGHIHGVGIRSRIYWNWYLQREMLAWLCEFMERSAVGFEIWYYPMGNPNAKTSVEEAARNRVGQNRNTLIVPRPMGDDSGMYGVERIEPNMAGATALQDLLTNYFGHQNKRYILGQTLTTEQGSTGLGSNLASIHLDTYLQIVRYDAINLQETMTREIVQPLQMWNFPDSFDIDLRFVIKTEAPDVEMKLEALNRAYEMDARIKESSVLDLLGESAPDEGDVVLQKSKSQPEGGGMGGGGGFGGMFDGFGDDDASGPAGEFGQGPDDFGGDEPAQETPPRAAAGPEGPPQRFRADRRRSRVGWTR